MALHQLGSTMRVLRPAPHVLAFYDGRIDGVRAWSEAPNWLDDGAYALGACSYAIVDGAEAIVYDAHISTDHAALIRGTLEAGGVRSIRLVLSHWHADHVAGNAVFADCGIIANALTAELLAEHRGALEGGSPPIHPLIGPTQTFEGRLDLCVGAVPVELHGFDIHSRDGTVLLLPDSGLLLAGDTLEDPVTYVAEPDRLGHHLADLDRLARLTFERILPNHGRLPPSRAGAMEEVCSTPPDVTSRSCSGAATTPTSRARTSRRSSMMIWQPAGSSISGLTRRSTGTMSGALWRRRHGTDSSSSRRHAVSCRTLAPRPRRGRSASGGGRPSRSATAPRIAPRRYSGARPRDATST